MTKTKANSAFNKNTSKKCHSLKCRANKSEQPVKISLGIKGDKKNFPFSNVKLSMQKVVFKLGSILGFLPYSSSNGTFNFRCLNLQTFHFLFVVAFWHAVVAYQANVFFVEFQRR